MKTNSGGGTKNCPLLVSKEYRVVEYTTHQSLANFELLHSIQLNIQLQIKISVLPLSSAFVKISVIPLNQSVSIHVSLRTTCIKPSNPLKLFFIYSSFPLLKQSVHRSTAILARSKTAWKESIAGRTSRATNSPLL